MKINKKLILIIFLLLLIGIIGIFYIKVYANSSRSPMAQDDEKTLVRMVTSLAKGEDSNNEINKERLTHWFDKYLGTGSVNVSENTNDLLNIEFNESGNIYEMDALKGLLDYIQGDKYTITYDASGGTLLPYIQIGSQGEQIKITDLEPVKPGYTFLGWSISSSDTTADYIPGDTYTVNGNATLYAVWVETSADTYTITYNLNGGNGAPNTIVANRGEIRTIPNIVPTRDGFRFLGWNTDQNATTAIYSTGQSIVPSSNLELFAIWQQNVVQYTITFNANGGTGGPSSVTTNADGSATIPTIKTRKTAMVMYSYPFLGWSTDQNATTGTYQAGDTIPASAIKSDMTLYAIWGTTPGFGN